MKPWAADFILKWTQRTAHEISASGEGAHLFFHVSEPIPQELVELYLWDAEEGATGDDAGKVELFVDTKWLALTGRPVFGKPHPEIKEITISELRELMSELATIRPVNKSRSAEQHSKATRKGPWTAEKVEEMLGLCGIVSIRQHYNDGLKWVFDCWRHPEHKADAAFFLSNGWANPDCFHKGASHGKLTFDDFKKHFAEKLKDFEFPKTKNGEVIRRKLKIRWSNEVEPQQKEWLWPSAIPFPGLGYTYGAPNQGKSPLWTDIAARISAGAPWPDGMPNAFGPRSVLMLSQEDDWATDVVPRIIAADGNPELIGEIQSTLITKDDGTTTEHTAALKRDISALAETLKNWPDSKPYPLLIIIDPITSYLGDLRLNHEEDMRPALNELMAVAQNFKVLVMILGHFNKRSDAAHYFEKSMGCAAMTGVPRFGFYVKPDNDTPDKYSHEMVPARRASDWQGIKYKTVAGSITHRAKTIADVIQIDWGSAATGAAEDVIRKPASTEEKSEIEKAAAVLHELVKSAEKPADECIEHLEQSGFSFGENSKGMHSRIRKKAGVESYKPKGGNRFMWRLRTSQQMEF